MPAPRSKAPSPVDWTALSAEQIKAAYEAMPIVLDAWEPWSFATGWSRHDRLLAKGTQRGHVSAQPSCGMPGWIISFGIAEPCLHAADEASAKRVADEECLRRGWRLCGEVHTAPSEETQRALAAYLENEGHHG